MCPVNFLVNSLPRHPGVGRNPGCAVIPLQRKVNGASLPPIRQLLVCGGDARIALDPQSGLNKYACRPYPDASLLAFGSSTASVISPAGFAAAEALRERLSQESGTASRAVIYARELQRIRLELLAAFGLADAGVTLEFATSGTDVHTLVARSVANSTDRPLSVVMVAESETGSGVAAALQVKNAQVWSVPLRLADGMPRPLADLDAEVAGRVERAVRSGARVLLVMVDQSKTGLIAPSPDCVVGLHQRHADRLDVLVDACQLRLAPPTLRAYLQRGFMVAVTGSKFLTGPSFSAALLLPEQVAQRLNLRPHEASMTVNFGLLLRWEAALAENRRFNAVPQTVIFDFMQAFAQAITDRLNNDPCFEPLNVHPLARGSGAQGWDQIQTIFPLLLYRADCAGARVPLNRAETQQIYQQLPVDIGEAGLRCQLGQPVACGTRDGIAVSALRLCLGARLISDAFAAKQGAGKGIAGLIAEAMAALDKTSGLIRLLS